MNIQNTTRGTNSLVQQSQVPSSGATAPSGRAQIGPWWQATLAALPTFIITRLIFTLLTYFGGILFSVPNYSTEPLAFSDILYKWYRWDAIQFLDIADPNQGYTDLEHAAFFPLYPSLVQLVSRTLHMDPLLAGMLISNLAFFGALVVLYRLTTIEFDTDTAKRTILYIAIFPTALFFFAAYNESLFLLFLLLSFYCLRRGHWWMGGLFGGLATLTRSIGLLLAIIFICEFLRQRLPTLRTAWQERNGRHLVRQMIGLPAILLIPLGLGIFAFGLERSFHDPLAFIHAQQQWRTGLTAPWVAITESFRVLFHNSLYTFTSAHLLIDLGALLLFLALMLLCFFGPVRLARGQWTFALFGLLALLFAVIFPAIPAAGGAAYDPLSSTQRFVLEIFPGFFVLARLGRRSWFHHGYLLLALPLLAFLVLQFLTGHWTV
ncbi:MAG: hypothetical protein J2P37_21900 [Ktedonobacteraceae bacterium]|nr:hypothetical protein [Ktedonobacteraceae bacterium]